MDSSSEQHPEEGADQVRRRRRPPLACIACRRRKVRCDRKMPCQNCVRARRVTSCAYVPDDRLEPRDRAADQHHEQQQEEYQRHTHLRSQDDGGESSNHSHNNPGLGVAATSGASQSSGSYLTPNTTTSNSSGAVYNSVASPPAEHGNASVLAERVRHLERQLSEVLAATKSATSAATVTPTTTTPTNKPPLHNEPQVSRTSVLNDEYFTVGQGTHRAHYRDGLVEATGGTTGGLLAKSRYLGSSHWVHAITLVSSSSLILLYYFQDLFPLLLNFGVYKRSACRLFVAYFGIYMACPAFSCLK